MKNEPSTHVLGLAHPPIPVVRIGLIDLGNRGSLTLERYMLIEHVEIKALCEIGPGNLAKGQTVLDRKSTRLNSSHWNKSRMPSSA